MSDVHFRPAPLALAIALTLGVLPAQAQSGAAPLSNQVEISIAAQPLAQALDALARQARVDLMVQPALVAGKSAPAVSGRLSLREALSRLLAGSGLRANTDGSAVTIERAPPADGVPAATLAPVTVTASAERSPTTELSGSYTARAVTIGKLDQSLRETPQSVTVVTRQQMDDQNLTTVDQVLAQTTGTTASQRNFGAHTFVIRGYALTDTNFLVDGVSASVSSPTGWMPLDTAIYDRVEVLRGAGGLVVGTGDPSGAVNMVRKRPRTERHVELSASAGSWDNHRTELDVGGALNPQQTVRARLVATYQDRDYFYDVAHTRQPMVYGVVDADLGPATRAMLGLRHQENTTTGYTVFGLPRYRDGGSLGLPRSTSLAQDWGRHAVKMDEVFGDIEHRFNDQWKGKLTVSHSERSMDQKMAIPRGSINRLTLAGSTYLRYYKNSDVSSNGLDANLAGSFDAFGGRHQVVVGASASKLTDVSGIRQLNGAGALNVFAPDSTAVAEIARPTFNYIQDASTEQRSVYASSRLQLAQRLHLLLGGRVSTYQYQARETLTNAAVGDYEQKNELTPYAGLVYDLGRQWSVYASYADIFQPQSNYLMASGAALDPAIGANYEAGVKGELYGGRLNLAAALFQIKRTGVAVVDQARLGVCTGSLTSVDCYLNGGKTQSKGFELEASGEVAPGWQIAAGYTHVSSHDDAGKSISDETPSRLLRASTNYRLPGQWRALALGASLSAQSGYTTGSMRIREPGRAIWDANASYRLDRHWTIALRIANLLDRKYYSMVGDTDRGNYYGEPRSATLTVRTAF